MSRPQLATIPQLVQTHQQLCNLLKVKYRTVIKGATREIAFVLGSHCKHKHLHVRWSSSSFGIAVRDLSKNPPIDCSVKNISKTCNFCVGPAVPNDIHHWCGFSYTMSCSSEHRKCVADVWRLCTRWRCHRVHM